jgi:hypothetical protein
MPNGKKLMTVKNLIELLQKEDQEALVVMSSDAEGNSYSPVHEVVDGRFRLNRLSGEFRCTDDPEGSIDGDGAVCLFPTH